MSGDPPSFPQLKTSELFRDRAVARYHAIIQGIHVLENVQFADPDSRATTGHIPKSSSDTALTAFAQLGALRLNASRAAISLLDSKYQYILAESTKTLSSQFDTRHDAADALRYGNVAFPRHKNLCNTVMTELGDGPLVDSELGEDAQVNILIIHDLHEHERLKNQECIKTDADLRFYAGVPLRARDGHTIGVYAILDDVPRMDGLTREQRLFMQDMATTIVKHLDAVAVQAEQARREKLVRALESFVNGLSSIEPDKDSTPPWQSRRPKEMPTIRDVNIPCSEPSDKPTEKAPESDPLWESTLPAGAKNMFSRAANILRAGADLDGVVFYHMSNGRTSKNHADRRSPPPFHPSLETTTGLSVSSEDSLSAAAAEDNMVESSQTHQNSSTEETSDHESKSRPKFCPVLGLSLSSHVKASASNFPTLSVDELSLLTGSRLRGRVLTLSKNGQEFPGDTSSSSSEADATTTRNRKNRRRRACIKILLGLDSDGRSFLVYPLWDFERQRFFAACICWTHLTRDLRLNEFPYVRIFSSLVMHTLSHLDALEDNKTKTTFLSSISHELRSPLHGILGGADFLDGGSLNRFQQEMVDSIKNCGHTLLDTIEHVMDFAKINSFAKTNPQESLQRHANQLHRYSHYGSQQSFTNSLVADIDLSLIAEEVVEAVNLGFAVRHQLSYTRDVDMESRRNSKSGYPSKRNMIGKAGSQQRGHVRLILKIKSHKDCQFTFRSEPGAWRRIIMNLFGNALKYTDQGHVTVSLEILDINRRTGSASIRFTVEDTGRGISNDYQNKHLFKPFMQEDPFSTGTGLGLSIVSQITNSLGGHLQLSSEKNIGTTVSVTIPMLFSEGMVQVPGMQSILEGQERLQRHKICILTDKESEKPVNDPIQKPDTEHVVGIVNTIRDWLNAEVFVRSTWTSGIADLVICAEPSFKHLETIRASKGDRQLPPVLFVAYDALEMSVLRNDARIMSDDLIIEVCTQPCGPRKLARALLDLLDRANPERSDSQVRRRADADNGINRIFDQSSSTLQSNRRISEGSISSVPSAPASDTEDIINLTLDINLPILIVDDNPLNLKLLVAQMNKMKISCKQATNGQEALNHYKTAQGDFFCILMDISMPVMDGISSTRAIRQYERENKIRKRPIIALTGLASASARHEAEEAEMSRFLTKPVSFRQLGEIILELLEKP